MESLVGYDGIGFYAFSGVIVLLCCLGITYSILSKSMIMSIKVLTCGVFALIIAFTGYVALEVGPRQDTESQAVAAIEGKKSYFRLIKTIRLNNMKIHFLQGQTGAIYVYYKDSVYLLDGLQAALGEEKASEIRSQINQKGVTK